LPAVTAFVLMENRGGHAVAGVDYPERQKMRVRSLVLPILATATLILAGCSSGSEQTPPAADAATDAQAGPDTCNAAALKSHIGEMLDVVMLQSFEATVPSHRVRVLAPDTAATMDMVPERANVKTDKKSIILAITCG
jgi:hypothetical protein